MEAPEREDQESATSPTVTRDKWLAHARDKLARGYVLVVGTERRNANFYMEGKGYEMCPYQTALQLVKEGSVVKVRNHHLGILYERVPPTTPTPD